MSLSKQEIETLLSLVVTTESDDSDCESCYQHLAQFAEAELTGTEIPEALATIQRHLQQCPCCQDEYRALLEGLEALGNPESV